jgi:DNA-directed RNA polymerase specialized sigma24 family protein
MLATDQRRPGGDTAALDVVREAFREVHGRHLHGFALLLLLGDAPRAARFTVDALDAAVLHLDQLRHPERAAAWLRARVVRASRGMSRVPTRLQPLAELGVEPAVAGALGTLRHRERAAIIAAAVERLDRRDVATVVGADGAALDRLLGRARRRYAAAHAARAGDDVPRGPLVDRVTTEAARTMR